MKANIRTIQNVAWLRETLLFFRSHYLIVLGLGLIAAVGRIVQLGAFGSISPTLHVVMEVVIESARILLFVYALGLTHLKKGFFRIKLMLTSGKAWKENWQKAVVRLRSEWRSLLASFVIYLLIAWVINLLIDYTAYQTCLYYKLKINNIIAEQSSEWVIILFFKNLSVIPLTLIFNALFLLWVTGSVSGRDNA
ncbi:hypothetical protein GCM10010967_29150 [Dyadobacter beijingensis]|uniref:Uncharacterized protein n=1 Tax=Dyadobacter beijingensis TaxID=365489 RepID=A0ABQ2HZV3_9BACT|nr:hypothetical protein [Dyadobacter beijingensis]GGM94126.1 hypothetical protein GCM10010967_29150 [Dyadobacter beijingensis]